jgi:predicted DNA-binding protein (MmcQ/YjbR family)
MTFDEFVALAESFPGSVLEYPFGPDLRVYKVGGKMFCTLSEDPPHTTYIKAEPEIIDEQRAIFPDAVDRAPYMHERHWNRVEISEVPDFELEDWLEDSYRLVVAGLTTKARDELGLS